jgi:uncharacterized membrane protein YkoI
MTQKTALILTTALTVFMIIVATALALRLGNPTTPVADAAQAVPTVDVVPVTTPSQNLSLEEVLQRDAVYRQRLEEANAQLEAAYTQMRRLQQQLQQLQEQNNLLLQREQLYQQRLQEANRLLGQGNTASAASTAQAQGGPAGQAPTTDGSLPAPQGSIPSTPSSSQPFAPAVSGPILPEQAAQIAQSYVGGGNVYEIELKNESGMVVYKVKVDGYEVYIDAYTGQVVFSKFDKDSGYYDDHDDHDDHEEHDD